MNRIFTEENEIIMNKKKLLEYVTKKVETKE